MRWDGRRRSAALLVVLAATACGPRASTSAGDIAATSGSASAAGSSGADGQSFSEPPAEGTGPEQPQAPQQGKQVVILAGPGADGNVPGFGLGDLAVQCGSIHLREPLKEDVRVEDVALRPVGSFVREDSACGDDPLCSGFVFHPDSGSCAVGIRWKPETGVAEGTVTLILGAVCTTRDDALCAELPEPPPPGGVAVRFAGSLGLRGDLDTGDTGDGNDTGDGTGDGTGDSGAPPSPDGSGPATEATTTAPSGWAPTATG
jgi:hypothetical protein